MSHLVALTDFDLIPVIELEPFKFSKSDRQSPNASSVKAPDEWHRYWVESLADSGITGIQPIRPGSWNVATCQFFDQPVLATILKVIFEHWGGIEEVSDADYKLDGGLALRCESRSVLIEPKCCADLSDCKEWKEAASYRGTEWRMLWSGHPWLSYRFEDPWIVLTEPHESKTPVGRYAICPDELAVAFGKAEAELERFAQQIAAVLPALPYRVEVGPTARKLAGLSGDGNEA